MKKKILCIGIIALFILMGLTPASSIKIDTKSTDQIEVYIGKVWIEGEYDIWEDVMECHAEYSLDDPYEIEIPEDVDELEVTFVADWEIKNDLFCYDEEWWFFFFASNGPSFLCWRQDEKVYDIFGDDDSQKGQFRVTKKYDCFACGESIQIFLKAWFWKETRDGMSNYTVHSDLDQDDGVGGIINYMPNLVREIKIVRPIEGHYYKNDVDQGPFKDGRTIVKGSFTMEVEMPYPWNARVAKRGAVGFGYDWSPGANSVFGTDREPPYSFYCDGDKLFRGETIICAQAWDDNWHSPDNDAEDTLKISYSDILSKHNNFQRFIDQFPLLKPLFQKLLAFQ